MKGRTDTKSDITFIGPCEQPGLVTTHGYYTRIKTKLYEQRGLVAAFIATLCFALQTIAVKLLKDTIPVTEVVCLRFFLQGIFSMTFGLFSNMTVLPNSKRETVFLLARGLVGTIVIGFTYFAIFTISAAMVNTILCGAPVFVGMLAWVLLRERFYCCDVILMAIDITGIVLIAQPTFLFPSESLDKDKNMELVGVLSAVVGMLLSATTTIFVRMLGLMETSAIKIVFYYSVVGTFLPACLGLITQDWVMPPCGRVRYLLVAIGFLNFAGQTLISFALALTKQSYFVSIINSNQVPVTIVLELTILDVFPDWISGIGTLLVIGSAFGVVFRERMLIKDQTNHSETKIASDLQENKENHKLKELVGNDLLDENVCFTSMDHK